MKRFLMGWVAAMLAVAAPAAALRAVETTDVEKPRVEVVFVLDTTGSMSGLIQAAKQKIWAVANTMATAQPTPDIRMGLVAYRDRGDQYVTQMTPLTADLDAVYRDLMAYRADGGGDAPESVNQALHEAVTRMPWSRDAKTYRVIFLVGDCPPHMDYPDDVKYPETCQAAARAGIVVNTIQCGGHGATAPVWQDIALRAEGRYFQVDQSGSALVAATPYDARLADLSRALDETRVGYGSAEELRRQAAHERASAALADDAPAPAMASRAAFNASKAGAVNFAGDKELVKDVAEGKVALQALKTDELPEPMQRMSEAERQAYLQEMQARREKIRAEIQALAAKRQQHLEEEAKKTAGKPSLDRGIFDCVKEQAGKQGMTFADGPSL